MIDRDGGITKHMRKRKIWTKKQLKKARWKRSLERAKKHNYVFGGFIEITGEMFD